MGNRLLFFLGKALSVVFLWLCVAGASGAAGPGLGQLTYAAGELFQPISVIDSPAGQGHVHMVDGYLFVPFSLDGNQGGGGFSFYDVSNPRNPVEVYTHKNSDTDPMVEAHGYGFSDGKLVYCSVSGMLVWDISDPANPVRLGSLELGTGTGYGNVCWSVAYQAPYAFVGTGTSGLRVVDLSDPANPVLVASMTTVQLGGVTAHNVHVVGNLLVATETDGHTGYVTVDISDPATPVLIAADLSSNVPGMYSAFLNGNRLYGMAFDGKLYVHDVSDPTRFLFLGAADSGGIQRGGYGTAQDNHVFGGFSRRIAKFDVQDPMNPVLLGTGTGGIPHSDEDFAVPLGNLIFDGNDHEQGSSLLVHQTAPDTTAPSVNMFSPATGASNQPVTSRVGITLTDMVTIESVDANSFTVRPQGGAPLSGTYSVQFDKVNFWPDSPLQENTTYEVLIPAGGIEDWSGNVTTSSFSSTFSTGPSPPAQTGRLTCSIDAGTPVQSNTAAAISGQAQNAQGIVTFQWNFGDGQGAAPSLGAAVSHSYAAAGNYSVALTVSDDNDTASCAAIQVVHKPLTLYAPVRSAGIVFDPLSGRAYNVNPDNDTVTAVSDSGSKLWEAPVGKHPTALARAPDGAVWVVNQDDASLSVLDAANGNLLATHTLPYASRPHGIAVAPDGSAAYVTLQGTGRLLRLDPGTGQITGNIAVGPWPRGIAVSGDLSRILVSRFLSPRDHGEVTEVELAGFTVTRVVSLAVDAGPDTESSGRGVPNYLASVAISPDGLTASVPSKKDNTLRGEFVDGQPLTFESTVRSIVSQLDLSLGQEDPAGRVDLNDSSLPIDALYNRHGNLVFIALQGSNRVEVRDAYNFSRVFGIIEDTGLAPAGIAFNSDESRLFLHNFLDRTVEIYDVAGFADASDFVAQKVATVDVVAGEKMQSQVLHGKRIFYNADDPRMGRDGYLSCAVCHLDGMSDERVWDFSGRGEGFRNTISLLGRRGTGHGNVHWTANFDEIQDFENDIRFAFDGTGLMSDADFNTGTRSEPLGDPKAGISADLDALAAYVTSLDEGHPSPYRNPDGSLSAQARDGKVLFEGEGGCLDCHDGPDFTDRQRHDVGTVQAHSGRGIGLPLSGTGFDTPTLLGIWETAPYLHDGSAANLYEVIDNAGHGGTAQFTVAEKAQLVAYLLALEVGGTEQEPLPVQPASTPVTDSAASGADTSGGGGCVLAPGGKAPGDGSLPLLMFFALAGLLLGRARVLQSGR